MALVLEPQRVWKEAHLFFTFKVEDRVMGLIHPNEIYSSSESGTPIFRLASAMQMKKLGVRYMRGQ